MFEEEEEMASLFKAVFFLHKLRIVLLIRIKKNELFSLLKEQTGKYNNAFLTAD